ncbi:MAG: hypothetical protein K9W42_09500 [Candidatus Heimdallarchaeota archaeon]|nr:hypothetical protein [Candidatus Heimdallarchaeota archaeon]
MNFDQDYKKQLMMVLILASALIPIYIIFIAFGNVNMGVSIFSIIYSFFIVFSWFLFYFDFFRKKTSFEQNATNGKLMNGEETFSKH